MGKLMHGMGGDQRLELGTSHRLWTDPKTPFADAAAPVREAGSIECLGVLLGPESWDG